MNTPNRYGITRLKLIFILLTIALVSVGTFAWPRVAIRLQRASFAGADHRPKARTTSFQERLLVDTIRTVEPSVGLSHWGVVDAFPETDSLWGAMQMRAHPYQKNTWYVATFRGCIFELQRKETGLSIRTVLNIESKAMAWLYSFALHPEFGTGNENTDTFYVFYRTPSEVSPMYYRVSGFPLSQSGPAECYDEVFLIEQKLSHQEHIGGALEFDDQGFLLIAVGDNGEYNDNFQHSQKIDESLLSGILRIDVQCRGGTLSRDTRRPPTGATTSDYFIPCDNPFVDQDGVHGEFYSVGFRNPFRMSFDDLTKKIWVGEVGQDSIEQIEVASSGSNHLWSYQEGSKPFSLSYLGGKPPPKAIGSERLPFYEYPHEDQNYCIVGGFVYRGEKYPELQGRYLFGDNQSGRIWSINAKDSSDKVLLLQLPSGKRNASLTSLSTDLSGRIFCTSFASSGEGVSVHELVKTSPVVLPKSLSATGYFSDIKSLAFAPGFMEYQVNSPLWSDGMLKRRWIKLPEGTKIKNSYDEYASWEFPEGTVFVKHFENVSNDPPSSTRVETRLLIVGPGMTVHGATYRWDEAGTDARLLQTRQTMKINAVPANALVATDHMDYRLPGFRDCLVCHNRKNEVLGVNALQLNRPSLMKPQGNQLVDWSTLQLFEHPYTTESVQDMVTLSGITDSKASIQQKARSYLHSNCSFCHYPEGTQRTHFDARISTPLKKSKLIGESADTHYIHVDGRPAALVIKPGFPEESALFRRLRTTDPETSMPYLGRRSADIHALTVFQKWIRSLDSDETN